MLDGVLDVFARVGKNGPWDLCVSFTMVMNKSGCDRSALGVQ